MMIADTNLFIYSVLPENIWLREWFEGEAPSASVISYVEAIGFHRHTPADKAALDMLFARTERLRVDDAVIEEAVRLKQMRRMKLGDSLIAATALVHGLTLATRNTDDFAWIPNLSLVDPFEQKPKSQSNEGGA